MDSISHSGRPLPGWGQALRRPGRTALVLATFAGLSLLDGCQAPPPAATAGSTQILFNSGPANFRNALGVALRFLDGPYHLVAFNGKALDENGMTTAAVGSDWSFTFSRYASDAGPGEARYDIVTVVVPGVGVATRTYATSKDQAFSPIENWDGAAETGAPNSAEFVAPLKAQQVSTAGAHIWLSRGVVTVEAGGKSTQYSTIDGKFAAVK